MLLAEHLFTLNTPTTTEEAIQLTKYILQIYINNNNYFREEEKFKSITSFEQIDSLEKHDADNSQTWANQAQQVLQDIDKWQKANEDNLSIDLYKNFLIGKAPGFNGWLNWLVRSNGNSLLRQNLEQLSNILPTDAQLAKYWKTVAETKAREAREKSDPSAELLEELHRISLEHSSMDKEIQRLTDETSGVEKLRSQKDEYERQIKDLRSNLEKLESLKPDAEQKPKLEKQIEEQKELIVTFEKKLQDLNKLYSDMTTKYNFQLRRIKELEVELKLAKESRPATPPSPSMQGTQSPRGEKKNHIRNRGKKRSGQGSVGSFN